MMKKDERKIDRLKAGMENLSEAGRAYIKNMAEALLAYQNSPGSPGAAVNATGRPGRRKTPSAEREGVKKTKAVLSKFVILKKFPG
jgi:hypothetical protein